ncbi:MAG: RNA-binding S4 domain-containing protein [bacterium]
MATATTVNESPNKQRIDQWLWHARFFKTRTLAGRIISSGHLRHSRNQEQSNRLTKPSFMIQAGDMLTFTKGERIFVIEIIATSSRRGPAPEARTLYRDHSPVPIKKPKTSPSPFHRDKGMGRPTKRERRALMTLKEK